MLKEFSWNEIFHTRNELPQAYKLFSDAVVSSIVTCTQKLNAKFTPRSPWINKTLMKLANKKRKKWDKYKNDKSDENYQEYKQATNTFNREKKAAVRSYESKLIDNKNADPKRYYNY